MFSNSLDSKKEFTTHTKAMDGQIPILLKNVYSRWKIAEKKQSLTCSMSSEIIR